MIKKIELTEQINKITEIFSENFDEIYTFMESAVKEDILNLAPTLFRKWYYGTIVENTILSPANIISVSDTVESLENSIFTINLSIDKTKRGKNKFIYEGIIYTIENHPLIDDLKTVAKMCLPDAPTTEKGIVTKDYALEIANNLSLKDPFYAEYLFCLLERFGLLNKLVSIHSYRVQLSNSADSFFKKDNETLLHIIIDESIKICAEKISKLFEAIHSKVSFETIYKLLQTPISTDDIFEQIYSSIGINIEKIWAASENNNLTPYDTAILSSTFYIGIIIDKYFMTVFSSYLKITEPFYSNGMDFKNSINSLAEILTLKKDTGLEVFSPCSYYKITSMGKKLIYGYSDGKKFMPDMPKKLHFNNIVEAVTFEHNQLKLVKAREAEEARKNNIYEFNIWYNNNESLWKTIEVVDTLSLEDLGSEICVCFAFENIFDYSFIIKDNNNFPVEYISAFSKRPSLNKTEKYKLSDINLNIGDIFTFNPTKERELTLNIECIGINKKNSKIVYPRIKAQSINITKEEEDLELI